MSTVSVVEARMVVHGRRGQRAVVLVDDLIRLPLFELVAPRTGGNGCGLCRFRRIRQG